MRVPAGVIWAAVPIGAAALALAFVLSAGASATAHDGPRRAVIRTNGPVGAIALDGTRLAYSDQPGYPACANRVVVFDLLSKRRTVVSRTKGHTCVSCCVGVRLLALAGANVAWIIEEVSNTGNDEFLQAASLPRPREHQVAVAFRDEGYDVPVRGERLENLVGSGSILAVNHWWSRPHKLVIHPTLDLVGSTRLRPIVPGAQALAVQSVDSGGIATLGSDGRARIYDARGRSRLSLKVGPVKEFTWRGDVLALGRSRLVVLDRRRRLEVYDSRSGAFLHSWPVPRGATNLDVWGGVAVYADFPRGPGLMGGPYELHALRLATGQDVVLDRGQFLLLRNLELGSAGLAYVKGTRTLVFVPLRRVLAAVD